MTKAPNTMPRTPRNKRSPRKKKRAYGYARVSTEEQSLEGISLDLQRSKIKAYAELHEFDLVDVVVEEGASGKDLDRPAFKKLVELIEGGEAEALIVYKLDRLTRSTRDLLWLIEEFFTESGTEFLSITEKVDTSTAMGKFFLTIMGALAQMERELISERTKAALSMKKEKGEHVGSSPLGFKTMPDGSRVEIPGEMELVRFIKKLRKRGTSYGAIASRLNREERPTKRGGKWYAGTVRYVCKNNTYMKLVQFHKLI